MSFFGPQSACLCRNATNSSSISFAVCTGLDCGRRLLSAIPSTPACASRWTHLYPVFKIG